jgi:hypothetical protein
MSDGFTICAEGCAPTIFECPNCKETIDSTAEKCRFCGLVVDREAAQKAALFLAKINQACSDASYMKSCAWALPVFYLLRYVPFLGLLGVVGFLGLLIGLPIWALRWWLKYGSLMMEDADFIRARNTVKIIGIVVPTLSIVFIIAALFLGMLRAMNR